MKPVHFSIRRAIVTHPDKGNGDLKGQLNWGLKKHL